MPEKQTAKKTSRAKSIRRDAILLEATEVARQAAVDLSRPDSVGAHLSSRMVEDRLVAHRFACEDPGYPGWAWEVSVARAPRSKTVTVCEVDLLPDQGALLAPPWVPWEARLRPDDVSRDDVLPYNANDHRLISGFEQTDEETADVVGIEEMGMGRARVLSTAGLDEAALRWYKSERGPIKGKRGQAPCSTCGFLVKIPGSMGQLFGLCANEWSPDDGTVVSLDHSCGAHSETDTTRRRAQWPITPSRLDDFEIEMMAIKK